MTGFKYVSVDVADHVATITFSNPPMNINDHGGEEILAAFRSVEEDTDVRVVILTAAGSKYFMTGANVKRSVGDYHRHPAVEETKPSEALDFGKMIREVYWTVLDFPVPVIAAVTGSAIGVGPALISMCDFIIAAEGIYLSMPEINFGLTGGAFFLLRTLGPYRARQAFFTGAKVPVEEYEKAGAIYRLVPADQVMDEARSLARELASKSPIGMRYLKETLRRAEDLPLKEGYRTEQDYAVKLARFEDASEAGLAWAEKRSPDWKWR